MKRLFGKDKKRIKELENELDNMRCKVALIKQTLNDYVLVIHLPKDKYKQTEVIDMVGAARARMIEEATNICDSILEA